MWDPGGLGILELNMKKVGVPLFGVPGEMYHSKVSPGRGLAFLLFTQDSLTFFELTFKMQRI